MEVDVEKRLLVGRVVAGEPARRAVWLGGDEGAVVELFPADHAPFAAQGARVAAVADGE